MCLSCCSRRLCDSLFLDIHFHLPHPFLCRSGHSLITMFSQDLLFSSRFWLGLGCMPWSLSRRDSFFLSLRYQFRIRMLCMCTSYMYYGYGSGSGYGSGYARYLTSIFFNPRVSHASRIAGSGRLLCGPNRLLRFFVSIGHSTTSRLWMKPRSCRT